MGQEKSLNQKYFDAVYGANADPWNFKTSEYEQQKYRRTVEVLPRALYRSALEIGCSIGVLTELLAKRTASMLSVDISEVPLVEARQRNSANHHVRFSQMSVLETFPAEQFDLIIMSEVGYYFSESDLRLLMVQIQNHLETGGHLLLVHWLPFVHDYPLTGNEVHELFLKETGEGLTFCRITSELHEKYRLDLLQRN